MSHRSMFSKNAITKVLMVQNVKSKAIKKKNLYKVTFTVINVEYDKNCIEKYLFNLVPLKVNFIESYYCLSTATKVEHYKLITIITHCYNLLLIYSTQMTVVIGNLHTIRYKKKKIVNH